MKAFDGWTPDTFDDVAGQGEAVASVNRVLALRGGDVGGTAWYITGDSGTGKGCIAGILAAMVGSEFAGTVKREAVHKLTPARVDELEAMTSSRSLFGGWAIVVDEAHNLRQDTIARLKTVLETGQIPGCVVWIFTTTVEEQAKLFGSDRSEDALAFLSRCKQLRLANDADSQRERALQVRQRAIAAGIDGYPEDTYVRAMAALRGNTRALCEDVVSGHILKRAAGCLSVPTVAPKPKKLAALPDEAALKAMPLAQLRALLLERGLPAGWVEKCSVSTAVQRLVKWGAT